MFRWVKRKLGLILLLFALLIVLKQVYPAIGQTLGRWISGTESNRVAQAFSSMISSLSDGEGISDSVEVFRETLQDAPKN